MLLLERIEQSRRLRVLQQAQRKGTYETLLSDVLLRTLLVEQLNLSNHAIQITRTPFGKPMLAGYPGVHFNLSHTRKWVVCGLHSEPVGVDVERIKSGRVGAAELLCGVEELERLHLLRDWEQDLYLCRLWSLKESYVKALGLGLRKIPLKSIRIHAQSSSMDSLTYGTMYFHTRRIDPDHILSYCSPHPMGKPAALIYRDSYAMMQQFAACSSPLGPKSE
ncbi:4'-phosphopantetheinyl transferase family protein [Gorillibacterium sp. sgz500922]|uniref:4'-phosphopantetheinyl transferase family protein n=1 Tax=Gorillibacterium sp. sgz500922 TaxID=3446694 RepID=UPI003F6648F5